jgi:tetratricopeptide (TPR) repeat protein
MGDLRPIVNAQAWLGAVWRDTGEHDRAEALFNQCIALCRELSDVNIEAMAENGMGDLEYDRGDLVKSRRHYETALDLWRKHSDWARVLPQRGLGRIACVEGDLPQAEICLRQVVQAAEQGNAGERSFCLQYYAWLKHLQGDDESARRFLRRAIESQQMAASRLNLVESLERAAWLAADQHEPKQATWLLGACAAMRERMGTPQPAGDHAFHEHALAVIRVELDAATLDAAWGNGAGMTLEDAAAQALAMLGAGVPLA